MPLKKKSTKKKAANESDPEPESVMSEGVTSAKDGKKKKKRKKKVSKAEKQKAKIEKATDKLRNSGAPFQYLIDRMDRWLVQNSRVLLEYFRQFDQEGEGFVSYDEFKSGMFDLDAPVNTTELHLLCQLLDDGETEEIEYMVLTEGLAFVRERELDYENSDIKTAVQLSEKSHDHCKSCKLAIWDGENYRHKFPRYVKVSLKLATFENFKTHPGHLHITVPTHSTISTLMELIRKETSLQSTRLAIFKDNSRHLKSMLPAEYTLEECGLEGSTIDDPVKVELFYDYKVEFKDCPLLMSDHYFAKDK